MDKSELSVNAHMSIASGWQKGQSDQTETLGLNGCGGE